MAKKDIIENADNVDNTERFTIEKLGENCKNLFGISQTAYIGATCGLTELYTVDEMKAIIDKWLGSPIKKKKGRIKNNGRKL